MSSLLQTGRMLRARSALGVSLGFLAVYLAGHAIWLVYGVSRADGPLVVVSAVGIAASGTTLIVALRVRGADREGARPGPGAGARVSRPIGVRRVRRSSVARRRAVAPGAWTLARRPGRVRGPTDPVGRLRGVSPGSEA